VTREAFGSHSWRWQIRILVGLAELSYTTGDHDQALQSALVQEIHERAARLGG
jgi:hypothetical protein